MTIRHYIIILIGLVLLGALAGVAPALWTLLGLVVSLGVHAFQKIFVAADEQRPMQSLESVLLALVVATVVLAAGADVLLFLSFGWLTGVGFLVLWLIYWVMPESDVARAKRQVRVARTEILGQIHARILGEITEEQLNVRARTSLERNVPRLAHILDEVAAVLVSGADCTGGQHRRLLEIVGRFAERVRPDEPNSALRKAVRGAAHV